MHPFLRSGFQGKIYFISESSGKSSSEEIRIPFLINFALYTHLYFHSAFLRTYVFIWAPQKRRPRQDSCVHGLLKKCSEGNGSGGSRVGQRKELSKAEASAWSHRGYGGWVKYPRDGRALLSGNLFFFFCPSVSESQPLMWRRDVQGLL